MPYRCVRASPREQLQGLCPSWVEAGQTYGQDRPEEIMSAILHPIPGCPGPSQSSRRDDLSQPFSAVKLVSSKLKRLRPPPISCTRDFRSARIGRKANSAHRIVCACPESFPEPANVDAPHSGTAPDIKAGPVTGPAREPIHLAERDLRGGAGADGCHECRIESDFGGTTPSIVNAILPARKQLESCPSELQVHLHLKLHHTCFVLES